MRRGRPAHPDVLTPREWEVLALIDEGLTNGEIAARLGISESGARFHVSEILSKLGLESRVEAASWSRARKRRWSMLPQFTLLSAIREAAGAMVVPKLATGLVIPVLLAGSAAAGYGALTALNSGGSPGPSVANRAGPDPCTTLFTRQCIEQAQDFNTLEEAVEVASFEPALPAYVPEGYEPITIRHTRPPWFNDDVRSGAFKRGCPGCDPRMSHNDQIGIYYRNAAGSDLIVMQGFPAYLPFAADAPPGKSGTVAIGEREASWVEGLPGQWDKKQLTLYMDLGNVGSGWARMPDGSVMIGSPMSYSITSDRLPLEDLVRIAESVVFE